MNEGFRYDHYLDLELVPDEASKARFESRFVGAHVTAEQVMDGFRTQPHLVEDPPSAIQDGGAFLRDLWWSAWVASGADVQDD